MPSPAEPGARKQITTPDGTVAELVEVRPAETPARGSARTKARKHALDILFEADLREVPAADVLAAQGGPEDRPLRPLTAQLVNGVSEHRGELDEALARRLPADWTLVRMPRVDRNLARLAAYELLYTDTDPAVTLAECVSLATELSTDDSPAFLNGVLGALARAHRPGS